MNNLMGTAAGVKLAVMRCAEGCCDECPYNEHIDCENLLAKDTVKVIDSLAEKARKRLELAMDLDNALRENQELVEKQSELIEKQNALLGATGVIYPKEENE